MMATNQKQLRWQLQPQPGEKKLNNKSFIGYRKAGVVVCLFLFADYVARADDGWRFDAATKKAYDLVLNLQTAEALALIPQPQTAQEHYVTALAEALELLITEDGEKYTEYEDRFEQRLERKTKLNSPDDILLQAEIRIQWAFIYFKFGHEFDAALNLRQAYLTAEEIKKRFPDYEAIKKTSAILQVIIGSVPEKYNWVLSLLNIQGSIDTGLADLDDMRTSANTFNRESDMLYALMQGFVLQQNELSVRVMEKIISHDPANRLALFLGAALAIKNSQSEKALAMLSKLDEQQKGLPIYYADYLKAEVYLHKAEYLNSITSYRWFVNHYKGQNHIKDAHYKIGLCYWLNGNVNDANAMFKLAKNTGKETLEADKYAARSLAESELPHPRLTAVRYSTDGGYYDKASEILESIPSTEIPTTRDQVEFYYRKARLAHKTNKIADAKLLYAKTIEWNGADSWYFAPNASLQLGYISLAENDKTAAEEYFQRALSYKKHEYKNSIDAKAKSALAQLKRR
jgi:hypothetical protein